MTKTKRVALTQSRWELTFACSQQGKGCTQVKRMPSICECLYVWLSGLCRILNQAHQQSNNRVQMMERFKDHLCGLFLETRIHFCHARVHSTCFPFIQEVHEDQAQAPLNATHPESPLPAPSAPEPAPATNAQAEKPIPSKSLLDWLRQQADYSLEAPSFGAVSVYEGFPHCFSFQITWCHLLIRSLLGSPERQVQEESRDMVL